MALGDRNVWGPDVYFEPTERWGSWVIAPRTDPRVESLDNVARDDDDVRQETALRLTSWWTADGAAVNDQTIEALIDADIGRLGRCYKLARTDHLRFLRGRKDENGERRLAVYNEQQRHRVWNGLGAVAQGGREADTSYETRTSDIENAVDPRTIGDDLIDQEFCGEVGDLLDYATPEQRAVLESATPRQCAAIRFLREVQKLRDAQGGAGTKTDAIKSKLKRLRAETGFALNVELL